MVGWLAISWSLWLVVVKLKLKKYVDLC